MALTLFTIRLSPIEPREPVLQPHATPSLRLPRTASPNEVSALAQPVFSLSPQGPHEISRVEVVAVPDASHLVVEEEDTFVQGAPVARAAPVVPLFGGLTALSDRPPAPGTLWARRHGVALSEGTARCLRDSGRLVAYCVSWGGPPYELLDELIEIEQAMIHTGLAPLLRSARLGALFELTVLLEHFVSLTYQIICERPDSSRAAQPGTLIEQIKVIRDHFNMEMEMVAVPLLIFGQATRCAHTLAVTVQRLNMHDGAGRTMMQRSEQATLEAGLHRAIRSLRNTFNRINRVLVGWESLLIRRLTELYAGPPYAEMTTLSGQPLGPIRPLPPATQREELRLARLYQSMRDRLDNVLHERAQVFENLVRATTALSDACHELTPAAPAGVPPHP